MLDLTMLAFDLSFKYRNPVVILGDGYLGQMTGKVRLPRTMVEPGLPAWAVWGDREHRGNLICSIVLSETELEAHNEHLLDKYGRMTAAEQRAELVHCEDAEIVVVACNTPARMAKGAVEALRREGVKAGLFRPITLWPFPVDLLRPLLGHVRRFVVVEASDGQLENELRLGLSYAGVRCPPAIERVRHYGGVLPAVTEIADRILDFPEVPV
jgi:pyruvate/2-oxoacid:ferredoxin oxidoreductase alpha subunit